MAEIRHELKIRAPRSRIVQALTDSATLERWQGAKVSGNQREWRLQYLDGSVALVFIARRCMQYVDNDSSSKAVTCVLSI
jgi:hypothetical protein